MLIHFLILIQACRGPDIDNAMKSSHERHSTIDERIGNETNANDQQVVSSVEIEDETWKEVMKKNPTEADILVAHSSAPGTFTVMNKMIKI